MLVTPHVMDLSGKVLDAAEKSHLGQRFRRLLFDDLRATGPIPRCDDVRSEKRDSRFSVNAEFSSRTSVCER